tara:strand:- start:48 stop:653 length:606 start_codon:yes stop_codon:yes gene_type:complete
MYKKILSLLIIFGLFSFEIKSDSIEVKKEKAVAIEKLLTSKKIIPTIYEDSVVIKKAPQQLVTANEFDSRGDYAYSLEPIKSQDKKSNLSINLLKSNQDIQSNSVVRLNSFIQDDLRVVIMGPDENVMISNGSFIVRFHSKLNQKEFQDDYNLILQQEFPDFIIFKANSFYGINNLLKQISSDTRISFLQLNLIDPNIQKH